MSFWWTHSACKTWFLRPFVSWARAPYPGCSLGGPCTSPVLATVLSDAAHSDVQSPASILSSTGSLTLSVPPFLLLKIGLTVVPTPRALL